MTTLTSTGAVNLTSSTNWSPAQIPATGDDLVIGAHTLTLDADVTFASIKFTSVSSRITSSGTTRIVNFTNGINCDFSGFVTGLINTLTTGQSLTLRGRWYTLNAPYLNPIANSTGGNLTLSTIGDDPSAILIDDRTAPNLLITSTWSAGILTTIGRLYMPSWTSGSTIVTMTGGTWNHTHTGTSILGASGHTVFNGTGSSAINWTGDLVSQSTVVSDLFRISGSSPWSFTGTLKRTGTSSQAHSLGSQISPVIGANGTGTGTITGLVCVGTTSRAVSIVTGGASASCRINWRSQTQVIPSTDAVIIMNGYSSVIDFTDLVLNNAGRFAYIETGGAQAVVSSGTHLTNTTTSAQACVISNSGALDGKVINLASDAPTLPTVSQVAGGTVYGYAASPLTGTGIVADPANLAAAMGTALESISAAALRRFVTVNTGETAATSGSVAALSGGGGSSGLTADQWTALRGILGVPASGTTPDDPTAGILDTIRDLASSTDGKLTAPRLARIDNLLGSGTYSTLTAAQVEAALLNDADGQALLDAISSKVQALFDGGADVPVATLVSLIATQITTDHGSGSYVRNTEPDNSGIASAKTAAESADAKITAGRLTRIDALPTATAGTAGGLALHGETGGGAGDASQDTLLAVQDTVDELAAALVGAESIALTGPVTGTDISIVIDSDYRQRSGTELPIPVDDSTGALSTRLNALGLDNLSFGAAREGKAAGEITGTVYSVTNAAGVTTIRVEISNAGSGLSPGEYAWQLQASTTQGDEVDNEIVISGNLILERRTVAPL